MLKNRSKAFAPKFKARRPTPASATTSPRPSVEPQLKTTPVPEAPAERLHPHTAQTDGASRTNEQNAAPMSESAPQTESSHPPQVESSTEYPAPASDRENLKRKSREKDAGEPAPKRRATPPPSANDLPSIIHPDTQSQAHSTTHATVTNSEDISQEAIAFSRATAQQSHSRVAITNVPFVRSDSQTTVQDEPAIQVASNPPSRSASPESDHEPPRFRYPTPENLQAMSAVSLPSIGAAGAEISGLGPAGDVDTGAAPGQIAQVSQIVRMAGLNPDGSAVAVVEEPASGTEASKKKKVIRRKKVQTAEAADDARATVDMQINRSRRSGGTKRTRKKKDGEKKRRTRAVTPEGAEDEVIDQAKVTMAELCKEIKTGKKFSLHNEIKQRIIDKKIKNKLAKTNPELVREGDRPDRLTFDLTGTPQPEEEPPVSKNPGVQMRLVDGQFVIDERTAVVDRHKESKEQREKEIVQEVVEDDFSRAVNFGTYMKRERAIQWDGVSTETFYDGLRQFGTDFESIAKMLPPRNRRQIKLKFNKEERANPEKITRALVEEKKPINLDDYEKLTGIKLQELQEIDAERAKIDQQHAEEDAANAAEHRESEKQKKAEIAANRAAAARALLATVGSDDEEAGPSRGRQLGAPAAGTDSAKENEPSRSKSREASAAPKTRKKNAKGKANKKNINSNDGGGEDFQVLGEVAPPTSARYVLDYN